MLCNEESLSSSVLSTMRLLLPKVIYNDPPSEVHPACTSPSGRLGIKDIPIKHRASEHRKLTEITTVAEEWGERRI